MTDTQKTHDSDSRHLQCQRYNVMTSSIPDTESLTQHVGSPSTNGYHHVAVPVTNGRFAADTKPTTPPLLSHQLKHDKSILALVLSSTLIYAGTEGGEILVFDLKTYKRQAVIEGHNGSVLGLFLSTDESLLFSSAGDRFVNVWDAKDLQRVYCIYSTYDVGDIFCVSCSAALQTVYLGAQNTSIQWYDLKERNRRPLPDPTAHPFFREDRFFDSIGPGGVRTPRLEDNGPRHATGGQDLEIHRQHIKQYAHYGYVYCMLLTRVHTQEQYKEVLISGGGDGVVKIWALDGSKGGAISELYALDDQREVGESVLSLAVDGSFLYAGRLSGEVNVWDLDTRQLVRSLRCQTDDVLALSVGGGYLFCAGVTGIVEKFNAQCERISRFPAHKGRILASAFSTHMNRPIYITGGNDSTISIWDIKDCVQTKSTTLKTSNEKLIESLREFISYRTVSSDPRYQADCRRGASHLRNIFKNFGAQTHMIAAPNAEWNPIILAKFKGNSSISNQRKKILFYGHYDVVSAANEKGKWITDPFTMAGINDYLYGRGTSDNKGPIMAAIYAVAELVQNKALESDITFVIEGEEECGSRGFAQAVRINKKLIGDVDWILLANSYWLDDYVPCLTYGLRGVVHATVEVKSEHPDLHSGVDGSTLLDESLKDLVTLLSRLTGKHNRIEIPDFYDPVLSPSVEEEHHYEDITRTLLERNPALGDQHELTETLKRRWREASLTIHRFHTSGPENSTIIPRLARASISLRLVPNQEAESIAQSLVSFLHEEFDKLDSKNTLTVNIDHLAEPWLGDFNNEMYKTLERAIIDAWSAEDHSKSRRRSSTRLSLSPVNGPRVLPTTSSTLANGSASPALQPIDDSNLDETDDPVDDSPKSSNRAPSSASTIATQGSKRRPLYIREGGSIPAIRFLEKEFNAPAAQLPCGQASDNAHLDNERIRVVNLWMAKAILGRVFRELPKK